MKKTFAILNQAEKRGWTQREAMRQKILAHVEEGLQDLCLRHGISEVYLFGSVTRPGRFGRDSDVDVAVSGVGRNYFSFVSELSQTIKREIDLIDLQNCRFAYRIKREGKRWMLKR